MSWTIILQLVMAIITVLLEYLGGGSFSRVLVPNQEPIVHLADYQSSCEAPYWKIPAAVRNNQFSGTIAIDCEVEGVSGGGLIELRKHMVDQLPMTVSEIHEGPIVHNFDGLPSNAYDVSLDIATESEDVELRGQTDIATNGFTILRNVFQSTQTPDTGAARYLRSVTDEVKVTTSERDGWYRVHLVYSSKIQKPWYVSSSLFKDQLVQMHEEKLKLRRERVLNDLAAHL